GIAGADGKPLAFDTPEAGVKAYTDLVTGDRYKGVTRAGDHKALGDALAAGKADSYGTRIAAVGQRIAGLRTAAPGRTQVAGPGAGGTATAAPPRPPPPATPAPAPTMPAAPGREAPPDANLPPALVKPPDLPPMVAPSIAALQPERDAALKDFEARRRAPARWRSMICAARTRWTIRPSWRRNSGRFSARRRKRMPSSRATKSSSN